MKIFDSPYIDINIRNLRDFICTVYKHDCDKCLLSNRMYWDQKLYERYDHRRKLGLESKPHYEGSTLCEMCENVKEYQKPMQKWIFKRLMYLFNRYRNNYKPYNEVDDTN